MLKQLNYLQKIEKPYLFTIFVLFLCLFESGVGGIQLWVIFFWVPTSNIRCGHQIFFSLTKQIQAFESLPNMWGINFLNVELKILLSTGHRQVLGWPLQSPCEDHWSEVNTDYRTSSYGGYYVVCIAFFGMVSSFLHGNACWVVWFVVFFFFFWCTVSYSELLDLFKN